MILEEEVKKYLFYCQYQRLLEEKTVRAYRIDLNQFIEFATEADYTSEKEMINSYIINLHTKYKQKSAKRKIASVKALFSYLESENIIENNPFHAIKTKFKEESILPKTIQKDNIERLLSYLYRLEKDNEMKVLKSKLILRDIAIIEMLFATGLRISELCSLRDEEFIIDEGVLCIKGKGAKERYLQIANEDVLVILKRYRKRFEDKIKSTGYFFINRYGEKISEQSARRMIDKYAHACQLEQHITPHMFRHSFATLLLEEDVDIRYIQKMLGHSSIVTTQIYTYVTSEKQKQILRNKHPRNKMHIR